MSAVISNSDPNSYLRAHADMEHDIASSTEAFEQMAKVIMPTLDALWREIMTLRDKRNAERRQSQRLTEEIAHLTRERNETDAYIGTLDAKLSEMIERMQEGVRS